MEKRKVLIDFLEWYKKRDLSKPHVPNYGSEGQVDEYLKSINKSDNPIEHKENKICKYDNKLWCSIVFNNLCNLHFTNYINCKFSKLKE